MADYRITRRGRKYLVSKAQREAAIEREWLESSQRRVQQSGQAQETRTFRDLFPEAYEDEQPQQRPCPSVGRISA